MVPSLFARVSAPGINHPRKGTGQERATEGGGTHSLANSAISPAIGTAPVALLRSKRFGKSINKRQSSVAPKTRGPSRTTRDVDRRTRSKVRRRNKKIDILLLPPSRIASGAERRRCFVKLMTQDVKLLPKLRVSPSEVPLFPGRLEHVLFVSKLAATVAMAARFEF